MKQLNIVFEDKDYDKINSLKEKSKLGWRDFILFIVEHSKEAIKRGDLEFIE